MRDKYIKLEAKENASQFRRLNGYGTTDPINLSSLLLKNNITTLFKPLTDNLSGMAIKVSGDLGFIMINQNNVIGRQRFTIGHELYHLYYQDDFTSKKCSTGLFEKQADLNERKADLFSSYLLMPEEGVMELIPVEEKSGLNKITVETIFKIQQFYRISINAVIHKLVDLELVDKTYYGLFKNEKVNTARKLGYDTQLYFSGNAEKVIGDYCILANNLFKSKKLSEAQYFEFLNAINFDLFTQSIENE